MIHVPVLVRVDTRQRYRVEVAGLSVCTQAFFGVSLPELMDDLAIYLMENVPKLAMTEMPRLAFTPDVSLRKLRLRVPVGKDDVFEQRFGIVTRRFGREPFAVATLPGIGAGSFAYPLDASLARAAESFLARFVKRHGTQSLSTAKVSRDDFLEILEVDTELPTILPSRPLRKKRRGRRHGGKKPEPRKREWVAPATLSAVCQNLTHAALERRLGPIHGRLGLIKRVDELLAGPRPAVLLVGPPGVGKTAIVHAIVLRRLVKNTPIKERRDAWELDANRFIAGMSYVGQWEDRCRSLVDELGARQDLLFTPDLPALVYTGRSAQSDTNVAQYLEPHVAQAEFPIVGECTPERLSILREEVPGLLSSFHLVQVETDEHGRGRRGARGSGPVSSRAARRWASTSRGSRRSRPSPVVFCPAPASPAVRSRCCDGSSPNRHKTHAPTRSGAGASVARR